MIEPSILAETEAWLAVDKPAGWLTIPGRDGGPSPVLSEWLERREGRKVWVVHRLDRETSGAIVFARTAEAHRDANGWFERRQVRKRYDLLAAGAPSRPVLKLDAPIREQPALTQLEVVERFPGAGAFLGRARIVTGRRHQIRIHLSQAGFPLCGDREYGGPAALCARVALHSAALELPDGLRVEAPWPEDFKGWVEAFRSGRSAAGG